MQEISGISASKGIAIGKAILFATPDEKIIPYPVEDIVDEIHRFDMARETAKKDLHKLREAKLEDIGEENAAIFEVHALMLDDPAFVDAVKETITDQRVSVEYAVWSAGDKIAKKFSAMDDEYMRARAADIKDISKRLITILQGKSAPEITSKDPMVIFAEDLTPSQTIELDAKAIVAFVTTFGSTTSHTAILARSMNIPALMGINFPAEIDNALVIVDGDNSKLIIDPDPKTLKDYKKKKAVQDKRRATLEKLKGAETVSPQGQKIKLYANVANVADANYAVENDAEGIGLFRSEFLYIGKAKYPTEEEQFEAYKAVAELMKDKQVIIRTLDIGADKQADYLNLKKEDNPAMGVRGIRICLKRPEVFKTQLRALYRASAYGNIAIMFPMIISVDEVKQSKKICSDVRKELRSEGIPIRDIEIGVMIETPASVVISDLLAQEVDFFSIGTNDLTQYCLAMDRQNADLVDMVDTHHPAVLRMIETTIKNAHEHNCWVGICGELGADTSLTQDFLRMGIDELSVSPTSILAVRAAVRQVKW